MFVCWSDVTRYKRAPGCEGDLNDLGDNLDLVKHYLSNEGDRAIIMGSRGENVEGHAFNAINVNGQIKFLDGQVDQEAFLEDGFVNFWMLQTNK